jgi:hypothetical protein
MMFRVLVIGVAGYGDYARLRGALDLLLAKRLPDVEILTTGGPGLPAFAACYARARGLPLVVMLPDHERHPGDAIDKRNSFLVAEADAAVLMADDRYQPQVDRLVQMMRTKGARVATVFANQPSRLERPPEPRRLRGLPD